MGKEENVPELEVIIGLEIHLQLTEISTKLFCGCSNNYRDKEPNTITCPICLGLPGSLPIINPRAIDAAIRLGYALHMTFPDYQVFSRKNYYYPDLPKNFQITQYPRESTPAIGSSGYLDVYHQEKTYIIRIHRIQLEEDPARLIHEGSITKSSSTLIDYNRSGMGLIEVVTEPDIPSPAIAQQFLRQLRAIVENQEITNCSFEGTMRVDANISHKGYARVEIKNITGHREVKKALLAEIREQKRNIQKNKPVSQVTKHWDTEKGTSTILRLKEEEQDYKYFPEPNLPPYLLLSSTLDTIKDNMPETLEHKARRFKSQYKLPRRDINILIESRAFADFFESIIKTVSSPATVANWMNNVVLGILNEHELSISASKIIPQHLTQVLQLVKNRSITQRTAQILLEEAILSGKEPTNAVSQQTMRKITEETLLNSIIDEILADQPDLLVKAKDNPNVINRILGLVIMKTDKKADPNITKKLIMAKLAM